MSLFLIMIFIVMSVFGIVFMQNIHTKQTAAVPYSYGSTSDMVKEIQSKLKSWGYYSGEADGIYGYKTYEAVKYFQQKNGLSIDGVVGSRTLAALGRSEEHTSELQSRQYLVCRLLLEKKQKYRLRRADARLHISAHIDVSTASAGNRSRRHTIVCPRQDSTTQTAY